MIQRKIVYLCRSACLCAVLSGCFGCRTAKQWRNNADERAELHLTKSQIAVNGNAEPISVESSADTFRRRLMLDQHLPMTALVSLGARDLEDQGKWRNNDHFKDGEAYTAKWDASKEVIITLADAILIAARNSREFQNQKDAMFQAALALDLEEHEFQSSFTGMLKSVFSSNHDGDRRNNGLTNNASAGITRTFKNGAQLAASLSVDLVKLLTGERGSSWGVRGDASVSIPLMRGSGEFINTENLTRAQRNLVYQIRSFEQYKRDFVVSIATSYLGVLQSWQRILNQEENYKRVVTSTRRSRRMADSGRLPEYQFDQAVQDELSARDNWVSTRLAYQTSLDNFKILIGLPPDALVELDRNELEAVKKNGDNLGGSGDITDYSDGNTPAADAPVILKEPGKEGAGPCEIDEGKAVELALSSRPDLRNTLEKIWDAQRSVLIAEDSLRMELTIGGTMSVGEGRSLGQANADDGDFRLSRAAYSAPLSFSMPWERTRERNNYRNSLIALERAVRTFQSEEDNIKKAVRGGIRDLSQRRSSVVIQRQAVRLAERRVDSTGLLLEAGRAEIRDVLEAQNALLSAQNSLITALVGYRLGELGLQRDLGVLSVSADGVWSEKDLSVYK